MLMALVVTALSVVSRWKIPLPFCSTAHRPSMLIFWRPSSSARLARLPRLFGATTVKSYARMTIPPVAGAGNIPSGPTTHGARAVTRNATAAKRAVSSGDAHWSKPLASAEIRLPVRSGSGKSQLGHGLDRVSVREPLLDTQRPPGGELHRMSEHGLEPAAARTAYRERLEQDVT